MLLLLYLLFVVLPVVLWFWFFFSKDRCDPGPKRLMLSIFAIGIGIAFVAGSLESIVDRLFVFPGTNIFSDYLRTGQFTIPLIVSLFSAAIIEESLKYGALKAFFFERIQFNQIADGIFYGVTLSLGFSFIENSGYFLGLIQLLPFPQFLQTINLRYLRFSELEN